MPAQLDASTAPADRLQLVTSALTEMAFALFAVERHRRLPEKGLPAWLEAIEAGYPGLRERIATFWGDEQYDEWGELMVIAWRANALATADLGPFLDRLDGVLAQEFAVPPLSTEPDEVPVLIAERLRTLREDPEQRARYVQLLRDLWGGLAPHWRAQGEAAARALGLQFRDQLASGRPLEDVLSKTHIACRVQFRPFVERAISRGELIVAPLGLAPEGQFVFGLPGTLILGFGGEAERRFEQTKERGERAALRFKVLSDPTRAAILAHIVDCPQTIGDIAAQFDLSQPTVSVHMKLLRQASLVEWEKNGSATLYRSRPELVREFVTPALDWLLGGSGGGQ